MARLVVLGLCLGLLAPALQQQVAAEARSAALCGAKDLPETGLQGDVPRTDQQSGRAAHGYNCGISLVGANGLNGRGGNANMAWSGNCAYIAGDGVAVVDVSNPRSPKFVRTLHGPGSNQTLETLHAWTTRDRAVLVAGRYGAVPTNNTPAPMDIYDVRDCARPTLMSTFMFPSNIHNLTISADTKRVYATLPLQVADISDLRHPKFLGRLQEAIPQNGLTKNVSHEAWPSPDGTRLYIGGQVADIGEMFTIVDLTKWPTAPVRIVSQTPGRGHSVRLASIKGRRYVLHSEESIIDPTALGCLPAKLNPFAGAAQPWLTDITDEAHPQTVSQFRLQINEPQNCATQAASGVNASVHYHDVDDPRRTTFAMMSMWNAGLRVVDVRDAAHPREVAYFNPGLFTTPAGESRLDQAWAHIRYIPSTGHIWLTTATGGFWVLQLEPQVRRALALPARPTDAPQGGAPRAVLGVVAAAPDVTPYYCTLGQALARS